MPNDERTPVMNADEVNAFLRKVYPQLNDDFADYFALDVFAGGEAPIGQVKAVLNHGAGDLIEIQPKPTGKPVLVPFTLADVPVVDLGKRRIVVANFEVWADESKPDKDA